MIPYSFDKIQIVILLVYNVQNEQVFKPNKREIAFEKFNVIKRKEFYIKSNYFELRKNHGIWPFNFVL